MGYKRNERGASLVEFALLLPVLVLILFGIIDFGSLYNNYQSVRQGARDGMRQAIVADPSGQSCTPQMASPPTSGTPAYDWICYTKKRVGLDANDTRVKLIWGANNANDPTNNGKFPNGNPVMVCVQYKASSLSGVLGPFINGRVLNTQAETLIETGNNDPSLATYVNAATGIGTVQEDPITSWPGSCAL